MTIQEINRNTPEGRLLITAIGLIATDLRTDKSASDILNILEKRYRAIDFVDAELKPKKKFEVGAAAKIIGKTNNHEFKIGEKVTLVSLHDDGEWKCQGLNDYWWVTEEDLELI